MCSEEIHKHGSVVDNFLIESSDLDPAISTHISATDCNSFLPKNFVRDLKKNKPLWWINRYLYGSFLYAEGLVYPSAMRHIIPTQDIPRNWKRIVAFDYGLVDPSVFLFGAIDEKNNLLIIYKEAKATEKNIEQLANLYTHSASDIPVGGLICPPIIDPKSAPKRDYEKKSLADHFLDYGISFKPGHINVDARIFRLNTYLETGRLKIMDCCQSLIKELRDYKFKGQSLDSQGFSDKPEDKNNHSINALEWITMELPADPGRLYLGIYDKMGNALSENLQAKPQLISYADYALSDGDDWGSNSSSDKPFEMDYSY